MTQRNPMNARNRQERKGASRKSASSAKPVKEAGASVRAASNSSKSKKQRKQQMTAAQKEERNKERQREAAMGAGARKKPEYKKWRNRWWTWIAVAIASVALSWGISTLQERGMWPSEWVAAIPILVVGFMILGYAAIVVALFIDFKKIRPIRKQQEALARGLSKRQKRELDAAIEKNDREYQKEIQSGRGLRMPWSKKNGIETDKKGNVNDEQYVDKN